MLKIVSVPVGLLIGIKEFVVFLLVFGFDLVQMFIYSRILSKSDASGRLINFFIRIMPSKEKVKSGPFVKRLEAMGYLGVALLAAMPIYAGGMWSAVIISYLMGLLEKNRLRCFCYLAAGSAVGSAIIVFGLYNLFRLIVRVI
jgi:uncharacterized membrane protein